MTIRVPDLAEVRRTAHLVERTRSRSLIVGGNTGNRVVVFPLPRVGLLVERLAVSGLAILRLRLIPFLRSFHIPRGTHTLGYLRRDKGRTHRDHTSELAFHLSSTQIHTRHATFRYEPAKMNEHSHCNTRIDSNLNLVTSREQQHCSNLQRIQITMSTHLACRTRGNT